MRFLLAVAVLFVVSCVAPSQHDPARWSRISVAFGAPIDSAGPWRDDQLAELRAELPALDALGPSFVEATDGSADLVVRPFDSGAECRLGAGRYTLGASFVEIDAACTGGYTGLRAAMGHEIGHALGMSHVCTHDGEASDCSPVGYGFAMMNPRLSYGDALDSGPNDIASDAPTEFDLAEFRRTHP